MTNWWLKRALRFSPQNDLRLADGNLNANTPCKMTCPKAIIVDDF
jgi:hypothetical protein